jgi:hypothetical protein
VIATVHSLADRRALAYTPGAGADLDPLLSLPLCHVALPAAGPQLCLAPEVTP